MTGTIEYDLAVVRKIIVTPESSDSAEGLAANYTQFTVAKDSINIRAKKS